MEKRKSDTPTELLQRNPPISSGFLRLPGFIGSRPLLSFVLTVLKGKNQRVIRDHLMLNLQFDLQSFPIEASERITQLRSDSQWIGVAAKKMIETMRLLADLWIDSGKSGLNREVDTPLDRNVEDVLPGNQVSLFRLIDIHLFDHYPRYTGMRRDGTQRVKGNYPRFDTLDLMSYGLQGAMETYGQRYAMYYFANLLDSPYSRHIARCDSCESYFTYQRAPRRSIMCGVFCANCKDKGSVRRNQSSRQRRTRNLVTLAADVWDRWRPNSHDGPRSTWIAARLNRKQPAGITGRWVTTHQQEIEAEVRRRKDAKGKD